MLLGIAAAPTFTSLNTHLPLLLLPLWRPLYPFRFDDFFCMDHHVVFRVLQWIVEVRGTVHIRLRVRAYAAVCLDLEFMHKRNMAYMVRSSFPSIQCA